LRHGEPEGLQNDENTIWRKRREFRDGGLRDLEDAKKLRALKGGSMPKGNYKSGGQWKGGRGGGKNENAGPTSQTKGLWGDVEEFGRQRRGRTAKAKESQRASRTGGKEQPKKKKVGRNRNSLGCMAKGNLKKGFSRMI